VPKISPRVILMFGLFKSVTDLVTDVVQVVTTPVEVVVDLADAAVKPLVEATNEIKKDIKSLKE
jgi:hypothetical protein